MSDTEDEHINAELYYDIGDDYNLSEYEDEKESYEIKDENNEDIAIRVISDQHCSTITEIFIFDSKQRFFKLYFPCDHEFSIDQLHYSKSETTNVVAINYNYSSYMGEQTMTCNEIIEFHNRTDADEMYYTDRHEYFPELQYKQSILK